MTNDTVRVLNTVTGAEGRIARHLFEHPVFGAKLVELVPGAKSFVPETFHAQDPEVFEESHEDKVVPRRKWRSVETEEIEEIQEEG